MHSLLQTLEQFLAASADSSRMVRARRLLQSGPVQALPTSGSGRERGKSKTVSAQMETPNYLLHLGFDLLVILVEVEASIVPVFNILCI